jgi:predicted unusual protein kinase regulating ubiquinone biosynthesis (AarF/ABC1/UbiB family)
MSCEKISIPLHLQEVRELESQFGLPHSKFAEKLKKSKKIDRKLFVIDTCLGKGSFGQVYKAKFAKDIDVAIKVC